MSSSTDLEGKNAPQQAYLQKASIILKIYYKGHVILRIYSTQGFVNSTSMKETEIPF